MTHINAGSQHQRIAIQKENNLCIVGNVPNFKRSFPCITSTDKVKYQRYNPLKIKKEGLIKMLKSKLILQEQEQEGDYKFTGVNLLATSNFVNTFLEEHGELMIRAICMINMTYENPDYLQVFVYGDKKFYVIADFTRDAKLEDYEDIEYFYVTFLMPEDY